MIHVITLGFAPARVIRFGLDALERTIGFQRGTYRHWFVDQHYPLNREENLREIQNLSAIYQFRILDPGSDLGLHHGFNWACEQLILNDDDILIMYDPDSNPTTKGWGMAMLRAIEQNHNLAMVGITCARTRLELDQRTFNTSHRSDGPRLHYPVCPVVLSVAAYRASWLKEIGGFKEENPYYGGIEVHLWRELQRTKRSQAFLADFLEDEDPGRAMADPEYTAWKWAHAHHKTFRGSFAEYLADGCPGWDRKPQEAP